MGAVGEGVDDGRLSVVAFVELGEAPGAFGHTFIDLGPADVAKVSVESGEVVAAAGEGDGGCVAGGFELIASLLLVLFKLRQVAEQEAQLAGGGDAPSMPRRVGVGLGLCEEVDLVEELVAGDGVEDVVAVELEVAEVGGDGGAGAVHAFGDLALGERLAVEVVGLKDAEATSGRGWDGLDAGHGLRSPILRYRQCVLNVCDRAEAVKWVRVSVVTVGGPGPRPNPCRSRLQACSHEG